MPRELLQARFDADDVEKVEQYAEQKDISRSEAMRRLVRTGADVEIETDDDTDNTDDTNDSGDGLLSGLFGGNTDDGETHRAALSQTLVTAVVTSVLTVLLLAVFGLV